MRKVTLAVLFGSLLSQPVFAGTCDVYVVDSRGKPRSYVSVQGKIASGGSTSTKKTNSKGHVRLSWSLRYLEKVLVDKKYAGSCRDGESITAVQ